VRVLEFSTHIDQDDPAASARQLEAEGFDYVQASEHMLFHRGTGVSAFVTLTAAAAATSRIKLLTAVTLLPLYPTILLAKLATTLDRVSGGRFNLGVGVGGDYPREFDVTGVPLGGRGARANEMLEVLRRAWSSEDAVTFRGRFHDYVDVRFAPRPAQHPLPIWVGGRSAAAMRRAGRYGQHWVPYLYTPEMLASSMDTVRQAAERAGRDPAEVKGAAFVYFSVYPDREHARAVAIETMSTSYRRDFTGLVDKYAVHGDPERARSRLREYYDAGARTIVSYLAGPKQDAPSMRALLASEVFPEFRAA
jgi:probable F420-dependent oxidoreductase